MAAPTSKRAILLLDARIPSQPFIQATMWRDYPAMELLALEDRWSKAREQAATEQMVAGWYSLEHAHWDWRNKIDSVEIGHHMLVAIECENEVQGIMAVAKIPQSAKLGEGSIIYVD